MRERCDRYQTTMQVRMMARCAGNARARLYWEAEALEAGEIEPPYMLNEESFSYLPVYYGQGWRKVARIGSRYVVYGRREPMIMQWNEGMYPVTVRIVEIGSEQERQMMEVAA